MKKRLTDAERQLRWLTAENERIARRNARINAFYLAQLYRDSMRQNSSRGNRK